MIPMTTTRTRAPRKPRANRTVKAADKAAAELAARQDEAAEAPDTELDGDEARDEGTETTGQASAAPEVEVEDPDDAALLLAGPEPETDGDVAGWDEAAAAAQAEADAALAAGPVTEDAEVTGEPEPTPPVEIDASAEHEAAERAGSDLDDEPKAPEGDDGEVKDEPEPQPEPQPEPPALAYFYVTVPAEQAERFTHDVAGNWPEAVVAVTAAPKPPKAAKAPAEKKDLPFPGGVVTPIGFRAYLAEQGLIRGGLTNQMVYGWLKQKGFPVKHYAGDGTSFDEKQVTPDGKATTRPGVDVEKARAWYLAKFPQAAEAAK